MKILVLGKNGQLGTEIQRISLKKKYNWIFTDRKLINLYELDLIDSKLNFYSPDIIINCAAFTDVNKAEIDLDSAMIVNYYAVKEIAIWCNKNNSTLIHISSDYVYSGIKSNKQFTIPRPV